MRIIVFDPFPGKLLFINVKNSVDGKRKNAYSGLKNIFSTKYRPFTKRYISMKTIDIID